VAIATGAKAQDMLSTPLTLEATSEGDITFTVYYSYDHPVVLVPVEYRINDGSWTTYSWPATADDIKSSSGNWPVSFGDAIHVSAGDRVAFRGSNASYCGNGKGYESRIASTANVYVYGNVMSLVSPTEYATLTSLTGRDAFSHLFSVPGENVWQVSANTTVRNHPTKDIVLPATTLTNMCYQYMFAGCQGLTRAPELPATEMTVACYASMFEDCTSLVKAPATLPTTTFSDYGFNDETMEEYGSIDCYMQMFKGCTSLKEAPALPATKLVHGVYQYMFAGCTNLTKAPELPAAKVADLAYSNMFDGCTSLNYIKCLATEFEINPEFGNTEEDNVKDWLRGVSTTGTFVKANAMTSWLSGNSGIPAGWTVKNASEEGGVFIAAETPLTLETIEDATTVTVVNTNRLTIQYSTDGGNTWTSASDATITISDLAAGSTVSFRGDNAAYSTNGLSSGSTKIDCSAECYVYGNVMSLINSTAFATLTAFTADNALSALFYGNSHLKNHGTKELVLPATSLKRGCYRAMFSGNSGMTKAPVLPAMAMAPLCYYFMFNGCSNLTAAPELPATVLADSCYMTMFQATGLTSAPVLPATTLANGCYYNMFRSCQHLTTAPELPATTLADNCYEYMFHSCLALTTAPVLPATTLKPWCYFGMFVNCTGLKTAPELPAINMEKSCYLGMFYNSGLTKAPVLPAITLAPTCYKQMFRGCQSLTDVPTLPATTLDESCYEEMFKGCTALVNAPDLAATTLAPTCCNFMFSGCTALENAPKLPATTLATQCYQRMFEGCTSLVTAPKLPATELADLCYNDMFWECTALKNAPELPATTLADYCYTMMFLGCINLVTAPVLPAATLTPGCYEHMFMNCNSLNYVKCLATDLGDNSSTDGWLTNVAATGTFVQAQGADWSVKGTTEGTWGDPNSSEGTIPCTFVHGIPTGWTVEAATATGLKAIDNEQLTIDDVVYDLQGRRFFSGQRVKAEGTTRHPASGLYIKNGKKYMVR